MHDVDGSGCTADALGAGASATTGNTTWVLQEESSPAAFGASVLHALRRGSARLVLFHDRDAGLSARLAGHVTLPVEVRAVRGASSVPADPDPLPVVLPPPDDADGLLGVLGGHGLEVVAEDGTWRGELLGLEVARLVVWPAETGGDGRLHLEAGVGRFDRDAAAAMHEGESPVQGLERAVGIVSERRHRGAGTHPLSLLGRSRWLRADALAEPERVGAATLEPVQTSFPASSVREEAPAAAIGLDPHGGPMIVVFAVGAGLDLVPVAADTRALHDPGARLVLAVPPRDHLTVTDELASQLAGPVEVIELEPGWR